MSLPIGSLFGGGVGLPSSTASTSSGTSAQRSDSGGGYRLSPQISIATGRSSLSASASASESLDWKTSITLGALAIAAVLLLRRK